MRTWILFLLVGLLGLRAEPCVKAGAGPIAQGHATSTMSQVLDAYGRLPLTFMPNAGQTDARVGLHAQGPGFRFAFQRGEALLAFTKTVQGKTKGAALALRFVGARREATPEGARPAPGRVNYLLGNDTARWRSNLPTFEEVLYRDVWPGIDLTFRGGDGQLKYEFVLRPGAKVRDIRLAYAGAQGLSLDREGNLLVETGLGTLTDSGPVAFQDVNGKRVAVASRYLLAKGERYGFAIGAYDTTRPLVIDPGLVYSTYLSGGLLESEGRPEGGIAVDAAGYAKPGSHRRRSRRIRLYRRLDDIVGVRDNAGRLRFELQWGYP